MQKIILAACWWLFFTSAVMAAQTPDAADIIYIKAPEIVTEENPVPGLPSCNEVRLKSAITEKIRSYYASKPDISLYERRRQALTLKNIQILTEQDLKNFTPKKNYQVADRIIMAKINNNIDERSLRLCKSENAFVVDDVYILMYPFEGKTKAEIINFGSLSPDRDKFYILLE